MASRNELNERLQLVGAQDQVRGFIFNGMLELLKNEHGPVVANQVRAQALEKTPIDFFNYPATALLKLLYGAAAAIQPKGYDASDEEFAAALRRCGEYSVGGFLNSAVGKTLLTMVGRGDPKRILAQTATSYRTTVTFGKRTYVPVGEREARLDMEGELAPPEFHEGVIHRALRTIGVETVKVTTTRLSLTSVQFVMRW